MICGFIVSTFLRVLSGKQEMSQDQLFNMRQLDFIVELVISIFVLLLLKIISKVKHGGN